MRLEQTEPYAKESSETIRTVYLGRLKAEKIYCWKLNTWKWSLTLVFVHLAKYFGSQLINGGFVYIKVFFHILFSFLNPSDKTG